MSDTETTNPWRTAIILFRHANDVADQDIKTRRPNYLSLPGITQIYPANGQVVSPIMQWRLADDGVARAQDLRKYLIKWMALNHLYNANRVITREPRNSGTTPNPLDTVFPLIQELAPKTVEFLHNPFPKEKLNPTYLLPDAQFSTLICWECVGMFIRPDKDPKQENDDLMVGLSKAGPVTQAPVKAGTFYVFTNPQDGKFDREIFSYDDLVAGKLMKSVQ